jgi:hypothetical protein
MGKLKENLNGTTGRGRLVAVAMSFVAAAGVIALAPTAAQAETTGEHSVLDVVTEELT